ncbi:hypothetical protein HELRODRAFT_183370 [Helobdella robusta]|uniref:Uncharacterized protein n=1 Tax=Helobdella robusta TaxID=6412 RepID=T1FJI9_HELRO|nr:hypothetical protein HELRODRAFT_183370 [Helobdella robusta]ESO11266.1 hypothetical protein HELRODRAFT_183370 [Helobdella robusta]
MISISILITLLSNSPCFGVRDVSAACSESCVLLTNDSLACDEFSSADLLMCNALYPEIKYLHLNWYELSNDDDYKRKSVYKFKKLTDIFLEPGGLAREVMAGHKIVQDHDWRLFDAMELYRAIKVHLYMRLLEGNCCTRLDNVNVLRTILKKEDVESLFGNCPKEALENCLETNSFDDQPKIEKMLNKALKNHSMFIKFCKSGRETVLKRVKRNRKSKFDDEPFQRDIRDPKSEIVTKGSAAEDALRHQLLIYQILSIVSLSVLLITYIVLAVYYGVTRSTKVSYNDSNRKDNANEHHKLINSDVALPEVIKSEEASDANNISETLKLELDNQKSSSSSESKVGKLLRLLSFKIKSNSNNNRDEEEKQKLIQDQLTASSKKLEINNNSNNTSSEDDRAKDDLADVAKTDDGDDYGDDVFGVLNDKEEKEVMKYLIEQLSAKNKNR